MNRHYKICQSCGMPLKKDAGGGGINQDGTKSNMYCSHCYQYGKFTRDCTVNEMKEIVVNMLHIQMNFPKFIAKFFARNIPKLERWKQR